jgi:hypothetical protein
MESRFSGPLIAILFLTIFISGCSSGNNFRRNRFMNLSEEQRQEMMQEMQQKAAEACQGKNEGDTCKIQTPGGEINASCKAEEGNLMCMPNNPMRQRQ